MKKHIFLILLIVFSFVSYGQCEEKMNIDLINVRLNEIAVFEKTLDQITDILGRPTLVNQEKSTLSIMYMGTEICYHEKGLMFVFEHTNFDSEQHCVAIKIFLSKTWDPSANTFYLPFNGGLTKNVTANWKAKQVLIEFAEFNPKDKYNKEKIDQIDKDNISESKKNYLKKFHYKVNIFKDKNYIDFRYEPNTTFLEQIIIYKDGAKALNWIDL